MHCSKNRKLVCMGELKSKSKDQNFEANSLTTTLFLL